MKRSATALAAAILAFTLAPGGASADWFFSTPDAAAASRTSWTDAILGGPSSGPPWAVPVPAPRVGCYFTRARISNAWRRVEVCY